MLGDGVDNWAGALFNLTVYCLQEHEVVHLYWSAVQLKLNTIRVTAEPDLGSWPRRWEECEVPVMKVFLYLLSAHPQKANARFVLPSATGN